MNEQLAIVTHGPAYSDVTIASDEQPEERCNYRSCQRPITRIRGHRRREYCTDACKQAEFRARQNDAEHARQEAARLAREASEQEEVQQRYGPNLADSTIELLRSIWQRHGFARLDEVGRAIQCERAALHAAQVAYDELSAAYKEVLLKIAELERKTERQQHRAHNQQRQVQDRHEEATRLQQELRIVRQELVRTQDDYHRVEILLFDQNMKLQTAQQRIEELENAPLASTTDRVILNARFITLGEAVNYRRLINTDFNIAPGAEQWSMFLGEADIETIRKAIATAELFYHNLKELGMIS